MDLPPFNRSAVDGYDLTVGGVEWLPAFELTWPRSCPWMRTPAPQTEIVIGDVVVRIGSDVEPERLAAVIRAVRQA
jgi:hypothetical protein